jgi:hypothetical protein
MEVLKTYMARNLSEIQGRIYIIKSFPLPIWVVMKDSQKKPKPTLESLLAENIVLTGKEVIQRQKAKEG